jgi:hypothetical protein
LHGNKYPWKFFDTTCIFDGHRVTAICHSSEDQTASILGQQKTMQMDDKLLTGWALFELPRKETVV